MLKVYLKYVKKGQRHLQLPGRHEFLSKSWMQIIRNAFDVTGQNIFVSMIPKWSWTRVYNFMLIKQQTRSFYCLILNSEGLGTSL